MIDVSPSVSRRRSKSSTLPGSLAHCPSAFSASRRRISSASACFIAFFCRLLGRFRASSSSSSSSSFSSSESLSPPAWNSANSKAVLAFGWLPAPARLQGTSSSESRFAAPTSAPASASGFALSARSFLFLLDFAAPSSASSSSSAAFSSFSASFSASASASASSSASSSSSSSSSSSASISSSSKSDALMPKDSLLPSTLVTLARFITSPGLKESTDTEAESET
mmetsp:Transcript_64838/g.141275  ORF Transcript_64838/g.141275 Transcript_64838/m.141275 type:complete len:225 (-) Transcript_64838:3245-3919(-)